MPLLEVRKLTKFFPIYKGLFRKEVGLIKAVDEIDFSIQEGKVLGMVGESGCGKSTAARAALRLIEPTSGEMIFMGQSLQELSHKELRAIRMNAQMIFQNPYASLNPRKTIEENIGEALLYHGLVRNRSEQKEIVAETLIKVGLSPDSMNGYPHQFSGGQQQRICIGRAIAPNPKLIICDEALSALDVSIQAQILNLLIELKHLYNLSYLFISHDLSIVRYIADEIAVLYFGKIVEQGNTEEVFSNPKHPYTKKLLSAILPLAPRRTRPLSV